MLARSDDAGADAILRSAGLCPALWDSPCSSRAESQKLLLPLKPVYYLAPSE